ncbi:amino acid--tRNA ligase-related protein [Kitasatospora sp. NPDC059088]|uniref:amino acid--tRNA ligase-related protein n=1 Tax=Kitasatospora sp. NPDC059088 TaxID=3346722 RepID=UPI0036BA7C5E
MGSGEGAAMAFASDLRHSTATATDSPLLGRVMRLLRHKTVVFAWVWSPPALVQCLFRTDGGPVPAAGSLVRLQGRWQPYQGRRSGFAERELMADQCDVLVCAPGGMQHQRAIERGQALAARALGQSAAERQLKRSGFVRIDTPVVVGQEATVGATQPFAVAHRGRQAYLTVNNVLAQHAAMDNETDQVYEVSRLLWAHKMSGRSSLNEITLIEFAAAQVAQEEIIGLTERVVEDIRLAVAAIDPRATECGPLTGLPVLTAPEVEQIARRAGIDPGSGHVLPERVDHAVVRALGTAGYWMTQAPGTHVPFYVRRDGDTARSVELRLPGSGDVASGSELTTDPAAAEKAIARWKGTGAAERYLDVVRAGHPRPGGMSLGFDRLLMHLLHAPAIDTLVPRPRRARTFSSAPPSPTGPHIPEEPERPRSRPEWSRRGAGRRVARAAEWLEGLGALPCVTSVLADPWHPAANDAPYVSYFGKRVQLVQDRGPLHHTLLADLPCMLYEIGPLASPDAHRLALTWTLDVTVPVGTREPSDIALGLIRILAEDVSDSQFTRAVAALDRRTLEGASEPGTGYRTASSEWRYGGSWLVRMRQLPLSEAELRQVVGAEHHTMPAFREFTTCGVVPASTVCLNLTDFPGIYWPDGAEHD